MLAMDAKLQRRIQRYGWDLAADRYDALWQTQLAPAHAALLDAAQLAPGERVLDVACGTGLVTFGAAHAVGASGQVLGIDVSDRMIGAAALRAARDGCGNVAFARRDAEPLPLATASFDVALCALGLMYVPDPVCALSEMRRVVRPGGRLVLLVWGERSRCAWSPVFGVVEAEVKSEVCPLFFRLASDVSWSTACAHAALEVVALRRLDSVLSYGSADEACDAVFVGGPVALAWSRFDGATRARVRRRYLEAIEPCRRGAGYEVPSEFVIVTAARASAALREDAAPLAQRR